MLLLGAAFGALFGTYLVGEVVGLRLSGEILFWSDGLPSEREGVCELRGGEGSMWSALLEALEPLVEGRSLYAGAHGGCALGRGI